MLTMNIQNQHPQQSFQAKLIIEGLKLPKRKFNQVNELYDAKTKGMPDAYLTGQTKHNTEGKFYHVTNFMIGDRDIADILTRDLKHLFETCSPKKLADMFVKVSKRSELILTQYKLENEIGQLKAKQQNAKRIAKVNREHGDIITADRQEFIAQRMESRIEKLTKKYEKTIAKMEKPEKTLVDWFF